MRGISIGIDVGTAYITTAVVKREKSGSLRLLALGKAPAMGVRRGIVVDTEAFTLALRKSLKEAEKACAMPIRSGVVAFGGSGFRSSLARGVVAIARPDGEITQEDIRRVMQAAEAFVARNPNRDIVHVIPRAFRVDNESGIKDPLGMVGMRLEAEALIIDGPKVAIQNIVKAFDAVGVEIEEWLFSPLAASEAILSRRQKELGVMLLDIGSGTTDYAIFEEGRILDTGVVPFGGERITHDIAIGFQTHVDVAEAIKVRYGQALAETVPKKEIIKLAEFVKEDTASFSHRELAEIIQARMEDVFELANKTLRQSGRSALLPGGVVLIGGSSALPGLRELAKRELRLAVERGFAQGIEIPESMGVGMDIASAIGATMWHLQQSNGFAYYGASTPLVNAASRLKHWLRIFLP